MRIEIVVNERNMSEASSKRGPEKIYRFIKKTPEKRIESKLGKSSIWMGDQCDRWNELRVRSVLRVKTNGNVFKHRDLLRFFSPASNLKTTREESKMSDFHTTLFQNSVVLVS